jgi:hypothetical protein
MAELPPRVTALVRGHLNSVEQLEVLLLLARDASRSWTADEVAAELVSTPYSVAIRLDDLEKQGLLVGDDDTYRYEPRTDELRAGVAELGEVYPKRRVSVINLIFAPPEDSLRSFSDAFRLRRDKDKDQ